MERIQFIPHRGFWHYYQISNESGKHDILLSLFLILFGIIYATAKTGPS